ncbi:hypothetical protein KAM447_04240 [Aeromonas caviae]|nr:hypothetical protein KAM447_04240 [Aeromonas caviae]
MAASAARCCITDAGYPCTLADPFTRILSGWRSLLPPASTAGAQSGPRLACPLYVWKIMQVNDWGRETVPRASAGRARPIRSFSRSFIFRQILSLFRSPYSGSAKHGFNQLCPVTFAVS